MSPSHRGVESLQTAEVNRSRRGRGQQMAMGTQTLRPSALGCLPQALRLRARSPSIHTTLLRSLTILGTHPTVVARTAILNATRFQSIQRRDMSVFNASRLLGKTVLITGASAGIGAATAVLFAKGGSNVVLTARRTEALKAVAEACTAAHKASGLQQGGKFATIQLDVTDKAQIASFIDKIPQELRAIDILVNNAGFVLGVERVGDISEADIEAMFTVNVFGLISLTQLFIKDFKARKTGHIINIGSIAGREPYAGGAIYCATKHAVRSFTGSLLREVVDTPIRVTEIQPGMVETEFSIVRFRGDKGAADKVYEGLQPLVAEDIAEEIVWAAARPPHVNIAEIFVLPVNQATPTLNYRPGKQ